ncbi:MULTISPECIES: hypothetical protein [unclassified Streptomyces]|nr:hypothetical protein [Streptomyces sp. NBC_01750]WSA98255.1 hypothetical protein OIE54_02710 [Streptomyces sp. NBC_01794]WSD37208.1 hypothetical protein OG966_38080 [Streptomyces sp. NBC_01750]
MVTENHRVALVKGAPEEVAGLAGHPLPRPAASITSHAFNACAGPGDF